MLLFIFGIIVIVTIIYFVRNKVKIKFKTFFRKGFKPNRGIFGIYCYCGKQGSGKTYSVVEFLKDNAGKEIYANLRSLKGVNYTYISNFKELLELRNKTDCIIFYDEIFTALTKHSQVNTDVLDFLSQMRKRRIIFLTTAQEWAEIPLTFRRYCRYQIDCKMRPLFNLGILIKYFYDAENMKWSTDDNDFVAPILSTTISKCNLSVANSYDTFEQISNKPRGTSKVSPPRGGEEETKGAPMEPNEENLSSNRGIPEEKLCSNFSEDMPRKYLINLTKK